MPLNIGRVRRDQEEEERQRRRDLSERNNYLPFGYQNLTPFVCFETKIAMHHIVRILSAYVRADHHVSEEMLLGMDRCKDFVSVFRNFIFREILSFCAQGNDLETVRLITKRYGGRFGIVRHIPGCSLEADEALHDVSGWFHKNWDEDTFVTRKSAFLDLMEMEEEVPETMSGIRRYLPLRFAEEIESSMKILSGECSAGRVALLDGSDEMLGYLKKRGVRFDGGITKIVYDTGTMLAGMRINAGVLDAALLSGSSMAAGLALECCGPDERICDGVYSTARLLPEDRMENLLQEHPDLISHIEDSLAVTCASRSLLQAWLKEDSRPDEQKRSVLRTVIEECTLIQKEDDACFLPRIGAARPQYGKLNWRKLERTRDGFRTEFNEAMKKGTIYTANTRDPYHSRKTEYAVQSGKSITGYLKYLRNVITDPDGRKAVCRLAYLYWIENSNTSSEFLSDQDMKKFFEAFDTDTDISWFFSMIIRKQRTNITVNLYQKLREWMRVEKGQELVIGKEYNRSEDIISDYIAVSELREKGALEFLRYEADEMYTRGLMDMILEEEEWMSVVPAYRQGFLTQKDMVSVLDRKRGVPEWLIAKVMNLLKNASVEKELRI